MNSMIPVSPGELIDKITILEIKADRITDPEKLKNVVHELKLLQEVYNQISSNDQLNTLHQQLREINEKIWETEDLVRAHWHDDVCFVKAARESHHQNDRRGQVKREINMLLKSSILEEKQHPTYDP